MEDKIRKVIREQIKKLKEGMSDKEWADAKEAARLAKHPEREKILKLRQMMDKEPGAGVWSKEDRPTPEDEEEQEKWNRGWYDESLKEAATQLGYLKEALGPRMKSPRPTGPSDEEFDETKFDEVIKASFVYTEQGGHFYSLTLYTSDGQQLKLGLTQYDEADEWLKGVLDMHDHEGDLIPKHYGSGMEELDDIVQSLKDIGIEASHGDYMDVS
jgi:hypothetical protein